MHETRKGGVMTAPRDGPGAPAWEADVDLAKACVVMLLGPLVIAGTFLRKVWGMDAACWREAPQEVAACGLESVESHDDLPAWAVAGLERLERMETLADVEAWDLPVDAVIGADAEPGIYLA
jgi:hypothetical protein